MENTPNPLKDYQRLKHDATTLAIKTYFILTLLENNRRAIIKATTYLPFLCHKSATTCHIDSYKFSNSKLKSNLCNCVKTNMIEWTAPPQQQHKLGTIFGTPCRMLNTMKILLWRHRNSSNVCSWKGEFVWDTANPLCKSPWKIR